MEKKIKITQVVSQIDTLEVHKRTIRALGLGRPNRSVIKSDTVQIRGMINRVRHLVKVEEVAESR
jgi:large subunit ribosomal protein L30